MADILKSVKLAHGGRGWRGRLQDNYKDYKEFDIYNQIYGLVDKLLWGLDDVITARKLWDLNPVIEGSINPVDLRISEVEENNGWLLNK